MGFEYLLELHAKDCRLCAATQFGPGCREGSQLLHERIQAARHEKARAT